VSVDGPVADDVPLTSSATEAPIALAYWQRELLRRALSPAAAEWIIARADLDVDPVDKVERVARAADEMVAAVLDAAELPYAHSIRLAPLAGGDVGVRVATTDFGAPELSLRVIPRDPWSLR